MYTNRTHVRLLKKYHQDLRSGLLVDNFLPALRPLLTDVEYLRVDGREDNVAKVDKLVEILLTKEDRHFERFCVVLEQNGYKDWAMRLREDAYEEEEDLESIWSPPLLSGDVDPLNYWPLPTFMPRSNAATNAEHTTVAYWILEKSVDFLETSLQNGSKLRTMRNLAISSLTLAVESIRVCAELAEEIKHISQVKKAGRDFSFVAEKASTWFESIKALSKDFDDLESSLGLTSDVMWDHLIDLLWNKPDNHADTPDPHLPPGLFEKLGRSVVLAKSSYLELMDACNTARESCEEAAEFCAHKEKEALYSTKEAPDTRRPIHVFGIPSSGLHGGLGGLGKAAAASAMGLNIAAGRTVLGANRSVSGPHAASKFKAAAASFRTMQGKFASLLRTARAF